MDSWLQGIPQGPHLEVETPYILKYVLEVYGTARHGMVHVMCSGERLGGNSLHVIFNSISDYSEDRVGSGPTYGYPLVLVVDAHVVPLPGDGGLGVTAWRDALHDRRLPCRHHHVAGCLPEVVNGELEAEKDTRHHKQT